MPYIRIDCSEKVCIETKKEICRNITEMIPVLPNKLPSHTMVCFEDECCLYFDSSFEKCLKITVELYMHSDDDARKEFTEKLMEYLSGKLDIPASRMYMTFLEHDHWGSGGTLRFNK